MAFYYKQNIILLISLLCVISQTHGKYVNVTLITQMCGETNAPAQCTSCIHGGGGKDIRSGVDVVNAMLDCAEKDITTLKKDVNKIRDDKATDENMRIVIAKISPYISSITPKNKEIRRKVSLGFFKRATGIINGIVVSDLIICSTTFEAYKITIPPLVFSDLFNIESNYKISSQLINLEPKN